MRKRSVFKGALMAAVVVLVGVGLGLTAYAGITGSTPADLLPGAEDSPARAADRGRTSPSAGGVEFLGSSSALDGLTFEGKEVGGLSALTYDPRRGLYYGLVDMGNPARFYVMQLPVDRMGLGEPRVLYDTPLFDFRGRNFKGPRLDGEGIAFTRGGQVFVASETEPAIRRFSLDGRTLARLPLPRKFLADSRGGGQPNSTFEALALSPDTSSLFTMTQKPLIPDGEDSRERQRIRVLRYDTLGQNGYGYRPAAEHFYLTDPGTNVAEVAALPGNEILVLERGQKKMYRVSLEGAQDVSDVQSLQETPGLTPLDKELVVDLSTCPRSDSGGYKTENYAGMALGPRLPDGRRTLLLVNDDGFDENDVTRVAALALGAQDPSEAGTCG